MWPQSCATSSCYFKGQELERQCPEKLWFWGVFSGLVFVWGFFISLFCEEEEISKIIQEKCDGFQQIKTEVVTLWIISVLLQAVKVYIYLFITSATWSKWTWQADATLGMCIPCIDFLARIPTSWLLTGWVLKRMNQAQPFRHSSHSIWVKETITVLKATTACESTAEETGDGVIPQWDIYIKELLKNSLEIPNSAFQLHFRPSKRQRHSRKCCMQ